MRKLLSRERIRQLPDPLFLGTPGATGSVSHAPKDSFQPVPYQAIEEEMSLHSKLEEIASGATQLCEGRDGGEGTCWNQYLGGPLIHCWHTLGHTHQEAVF